MPRKRVHEYAPPSPWLKDDLLTAERRAGETGLSEAVSLERPQETAAEALRAKSNVAANMRRMRAGKRELGEIPPCAHRELRDSCRLDLLKFGITYCMSTPKNKETGEPTHRRFLRRPPSKRMCGFVKRLQETVLHGGNKHVRWPRGKGKSTWVKIAALWALVYGHRHFVVVLAATMPMAEECVTNIWDAIARDPQFCADFPEWAVPCADVDGANQRMRLQSYKGKKTEIANNTRFHYLRFAQLEGYPETGGIIAWRGAAQAIRGLNVSNLRPDFVFIDDPQTDEQAKSPTQVAKIEDNINGAIMGLAGSGETMASIMASTPIEPDDVSCRFADEDRHPEWQTETETLVTKWGPDEWVDRYLNMLRADNHAHDAELRKSRAFYEKYQDKIEEGVEMMDDGDYDPATEVSAYQHALIKLHVMKKKRFFSEMQMLPTGLELAVPITAALIEGRQADSVRSETPEGFDFVVAATDINPSYALSTVVMAFRPDCTARILRHELERISIDSRLNDNAYCAAVMKALAGHAKKLKNWAKTIGVWGVDCGGTQWTAVNEFRRVAKNHFGGLFMPMAGRSHLKFNPNVKSRIRDAYNGTVLCADPSSKHRWCAWDADVYKEKVHRALMSEVGAPGGCSLYKGDDHSEFAFQVANERLLCITSRGEFSWKTAEPHDFLDCCAMCYAIAGGNGITGMTADIVTDLRQEQTTGLKASRIVSGAKAGRVARKLRRRIVSL